MKKATKIFGIILVSATTFLLAYKSAYWVGETFFFDKFFYYKSIEHGYWISNKILSLKDFGERSEDVINLNKTELKNNNDAKILGSSTDTNTSQKFTIAIIGDSYVWGQGLLFEDTVSQILEKKLNKIKPTEVLSIANCGDSILDFYINYLKVEKNHNPDFITFVFVENDLLLQSYKQAIRNYEKINFFNECQKENLKSPSYENNDIPNEYRKRVEDSWNNPTDICILENSLKRMPNEALYLSGAAYKDEILDKYYYYLQKNQKEPKDILKLIEPNKSYTVSKKDGHPSAELHRLYADLIFNEIITSQQWINH